VTSASPADPVGFVSRKSPVRFPSDSPGQGEARALTESLQSAVGSAASKALEILYSSETDG